MTNLDTLHLRSHAEGVCRDTDWIAIGSVARERFPVVYRALQNAERAEELYAYSLDILCLMALTEALGLEYGEFVNYSFGEHKR